MDKKGPVTVDMTDNYKSLVDMLKTEGLFNVRAKDFVFTDSTSEHEVHEKRSDYYHKYPLKSFDTVIEKTKQIEINNDLLISLYDELMFSELCFLEGYPIFNSYFNCIFFHNLELLQKNELLYSIMGTSVMRLKKLFYHVYKGGVLNNDDFCFSFIPFNQYFDEKRLMEIMDKNEEEYRDSNLKVKSKLMSFKRSQ